MRLSSLFGLCTSIAFVIGAATTALAQSSEPQPETRQSTIENAAAEKAKSLQPYEVTTAEKVITRIERRFTNQTIRWHPYLQNAYRGGGFAAGAGYMFHTRRIQHSRRPGQLQHQVVQARRGGVHLAAPVRPAGRTDGSRRLAGRNGGGILRRRDEHLERRPRELRVRAAVRIGVVDDSADARTVHGARRLRGVAMGPEVGYKARRRRSTRSIRRSRCPGSARRRRSCTRRRPSDSTRARPSDYARRGGFYGVTGHDYTDRDDALGFRQVDYEVIQHIPILRETWVRLAARSREDDLGQGRPGDAVLSAAVGGRRIQPARLLQLSLHRPQQPAAAGGVADHGQPLLRERGVL